MKGILNLSLVVITLLFGLLNQYLHLVSGVLRALLVVEIWAIMLDQEARRANRNVNTISTGLGMFMYYNTGDSNNRFQTNSNNTAMNSSFTTDTVGDAFMFEVDMDNGTVRVRKDDGSDSGLFTML